MAWRLLILLTTLTVPWGAAERAELSLEEGAPCPYMQTYPESRCMKTCPTIEYHFIHKTLERGEVVPCNVAQGLICCPNQPPQNSSLQQPTPAMPLNFQQEHNARQYPHLAALRFLRSGTLDRNIYRCTAVLVRPNFVLTSALCGGSLRHMETSPNRARLGLAKPYKVPLQITGYNNYKDNNDLFLLRLNGNYSHESVARICSQQDMDRARRLVAVGFSQLGEENCDWFEMEVSLRKFSSCLVQLNNSIRGIDSQLTHLCVEPINPPRAAPGACVQCLRGSASVLHAVLPDEGICVVGVATPTTGNCHHSGPRLYYTSLLNHEVLDFIHGTH